MFTNTQEKDDPHSIAPQGNGTQNKGLSWIKAIFKGKPDPTLRETIEEYIDEPDEETDADPVLAQERILLSNILDLRDITVADVMVPRADILAIEENISKEELFALLTEHQVSRFPVYRGTLDEIIGTIHIKDILGALVTGKEIDILSMIREVPIISPTLPVLDLIIAMRDSRRHMALVIDEFGGIDGLVTLGDIIESIVGELDDEHGQDETPQIIKYKSGNILADGRAELEDIEEECGIVFSEEEKEMSDTLGGLVCDIAGRVPVIGEIIPHESGVIFEIEKADPRRVHRIKIKNIPQSSHDAP